MIKYGGIYPCNKACRKLYRDIKQNKSSQEYLEHMYGSE